jgi:hypothetical protein
VAVVHAVVEPVQEQQARAARLQRRVLPRQKSQARQAARQQTADPPQVMTQQARLPWQRSEARQAARKQTADPPQGARQEAQLERPWQARYTVSAPSFAQGPAKTHRYARKE